MPRFLRKATAARFGALSFDLVNFLNAFEELGFVVRQLRVVPLTVDLDALLKESVLVARLASIFLSTFLHFVQLRGQLNLR